MTAFLTCFSTDSGARLDVDEPLRNGDTELFQDVKLLGCRFGVLYDPFIF
jgi:hypothetical protein